MAEKFDKSQVIGGKCGCGGPLCSGKLNEKKKGFRKGKKQR